MANARSKEALIALNKRLATYTTHKIFLKGDTAKPPVDTPWIRQDAIFSRPVSLGAFASEDAGEGSAGGTYRCAIIYQATVFVPSGKMAEVEASGIVDTIADLFPRGLRLTEGSVSVKVEETYRGTAQPDDVWLRLPVTVEAWYYAPY